MIKTCPETCPAKICPLDCPDLSRQTLKPKLEPVPDLSLSCPGNRLVAPVLSPPL